MLHRAYKAAKWSAGPRVLDSCPAVMPVLSFRDGPSGRDSGVSLHGSGVGALGRGTMVSGTDVDNFGATLVASGGVVSARVSWRVSAVWVVLVVVT